jgi:hypothetical protein
MTTSRISFVVITLILILGSSAIAQYQVGWYTFTNGGGVLSSTNYNAAASVSQTAIGSLTGSNFLAYIGFWYPGILTGITEDKTGETIEPNALVTRLYNARPNPFANQTAIRYSLSAKSKASLFIYDITGRLVKTLVNASIEPGVYSINWNGKNERDQQVASGVYFYQLKTDNYLKTNKLLLTK